MLKLQQFPKVSDLPIPRDRFDHCLIAGAFAEQVDMNGAIRPFVTYIPEGQRYDNPCLVVAPPSGTDPMEFLETSGLKEFADEQMLFLHIMQDQGGWDLTGADADYMTYVYARIQHRVAYVTMQDNIYALGIGDGATVAHQACMRNTLEWSGLATVGSLDEKEALRNAGEPEGEALPIPLTGEMVIQGGKGQLPVWMAVPSKTAADQAVIDYWKTWNDSTSEMLSGAGATEIWMPSTVCHYNQFDEEKIAQVRVTEGAQGWSMDLFRRMWAYVSRARRHRGAGKKLLRWYKSPEDYGAVRHELEHEGWTRIWYEYTPASVKDSGKPAPLVVCMHGRGGSADSFMDITGMTVVAAERGFTVVFPQASMYQQTPPDGLRNILQWSDKTAEPNMHNVDFLRKVVADVASRVPVDMGRIYCCGQSSGGAMSHDLALYASDLFAAAAPWSGASVPDGVRTITENKIPLLYMRGDRDGGAALELKAPYPFPLTARHRPALAYFMDRYGLDPSQVNRWKSGAFEYYEFRDARGVPMITYCIIDDMPHANIPQQSWLTYDLFLSRFSRREDGRLLYMGNPVE